MRQISLGSETYRRTIAAKLEIGNIETVVLGHLYTGGALTRARSRIGSASPQARRRRYSAELSGLDT
jgi:hypothetical protein